MARPWASFDVLALVSHLGRVVGVPLRGELHLGAYLARWLAEYDGTDRPWGYSFVATSAGAPFSDSLDVAMTELTESGLLIDVPYGLAFTQRGTAEFNFLRELGQLRWRETYASTVADIAELIPMGLLREAILSDADMQTAIRFGATRPLDAPSQSLRRMKEIRALRSAVSPSLSLAGVGALWLSFLANQRLAERLEAS